MTFAPLGSLPFAAACASGLASAYLLVGLRRLPGARRTKLLARQLTHLAAADLVATAVMIQMWILNTGVTGGWSLERMPEALRNPFCSVTALLSAFGNEAAMLLEVHIALAFAASTCKSLSSLRALSRCLPFAWLLAFGLAALTPVLDQPIWFDETSRASVCFTHSRYWVLLSSILVVSASCSVCYISSTVYVLKAGAAVQRSVGARARSYLIAAVLTSSPFAVYNIVPLSLIQQSRGFWDAWYLASTMLFDLSGLLHYAIYALHCRSARKLVAGERVGNNDRSDHSFRVGFSDWTSVCVVRLHHVETDISGTASEPQENSPHSYFDDAWTDVSWLNDETHPVARRTKGGLWSATDFADDGEQSGSSTSAGTVWAAEGRAV